MRAMTLPIAQCESGWAGPDTRALRTRPDRITAKPLLGRLNRTGLAGILSRLELVLKEPIR